LKRKGQPFLGQVALAICEDCATCKAARDKAEQDEIQRARVKAAKEEADAKRKKAQAEKAEEAKRRAANKPSTFVATCVFVSLAALSRFSLVNRGSFGRVRTADLHPSRHQKGVTVQQLGYAASRRQYEFTF